MVNEIRFSFSLIFIEIEYERYHLDSMVFHHTALPREEYIEYTFHEDNLILSTLEDIGLGYDNEIIYIHSSMNE